MHGCRSHSQLSKTLHHRETANSERVQDTFSLTATDSAGSVVRIDGGTFHFTMVASRVK